eukprot:GAHX01002637.1.p1 GENE.GAHX01002637.1~~GAHX01002637.1.p1  ORF type:complete len:175 (-),score=40.54 GAHX01002637.1:180-677(-)
MSKNVLNNIGYLSLNNNGLANYRQNVTLLRTESKENELGTFQDTEESNFKDNKILLLEKIIVKKNKEINKLKESLRVSLEQNEFLDQELEELRRMCIEENQNTQNEINIREQDIQESFLEFEKNKTELDNIANDLDKKQKEIDRINKVKTKFCDCFSMTETDVDM